jgi:hypothetical protein
VYETPASSIFGDDPIPATRRQPQVYGLAVSSIPSCSAPSGRSQEHLASCLTCRHCSTQFTGTYRRGNLARHTRQKHSGMKSRAYNCRAINCLRAFRRSDARLKHERKAHLKHGVAPAHERSFVQYRVPLANPIEDEPSAITLEPIDGTSALPQSPSDNEDRLSAEADTPEHPMFPNVSALPAAAWRTFFKLRSELDDVAYSQHCDRLFARWAVLAEALRVQESVACLNSFLVY